MKRALFKPTFAPSDYSYDDPFSSSLKLMQNVCAKTLRPIESWQDLEIITQLNYQQTFKDMPDFDAIQYYSYRS